MGFEGWFHERTLGVSPRLFGTAALVLFFDQPAGAVGLGGGSQFDACKLAGADDADRSVLANSESMAFEFAAFLGDAAELVEVPQLAGDFVDRADDDAGCASIDFVAERSSQPASRRTRRASGPRRVLAFADAAICRFANRTASVPERFERRLVSLLFDAVGIEADSRPDVHHLASSNVSVSKLVNWLN